MNSALKKDILLFLLFIFSFVGFAQQPNIQTEIDTIYIRIGEQFQYKITVDKVKNVQFPKELQNLQSIELVESKKVDSLKNKLIKKYTLTGFDSGSYKIPRQQIFIDSKRYLTDSLLINVATVKVDTIKQNLFPIKANRKEPITWVDYITYLKWIIPILLLLTLLIAYYFSRSKYKRKQAEKRLTPYENAISGLELLDSKQLWQNNKTKQYYIELTDILRTYIEGDLKVPALESTTDELIETITDLRKIKKIKVSSNSIKRLKKLLREADLVKFAKYRPISEEIDKHRTITEELVIKLKTKNVTTNVEQ